MDIAEAFHEISGIGNPASCLLDISSCSPGKFIVSAFDQPSTSLPAKGSKVHYIGSILASDPGSLGLQFFYVKCRKTFVDSTNTYVTFGSIHSDIA